MIRRISVNRKEKSINPFVWENVPQFAIICGVNGSGKTQLLELISSAADSAGHSIPAIRLHMMHPIEKGMVQYITSHHRFDNLSGGNGTTAHVESRWTKVTNSIRSRKGGGAFNPINQLVHEIEKKSGRKVDELTDIELAKFLPPDYMQMLESHLNNQYIAELFKSYQMKVDSLQLHYLREKGENKGLREIYDELGCSPPWISINDIFDKYGFSYNIAKPVFGYQYSPSFVDKRDPRISVNFGSLSSGEQVIVSLLLWAYNSKLGFRNSILLMDEFDAHLNPSMSQMFIEVVKDKLVKEYRLQVIMTSHSPSTVAFADEKDVFWMEKGREIGQKTKGEVVASLSNGVMTYDEGSALLTAVDSSTADIVILTEGKTDITHIETAKEKLGEDISYDIMTCECATKLQSFLLGCPDKFVRKKIIGVFDHDREGLTCFAKVMSSGNSVMIKDGIHRLKNNEFVYAMVLPVPHQNFSKYKYCPVEFMYKKSILEKYKLIEKRDIRDINYINSRDDQVGSVEYNEAADLWFYKLSEKHTSKREFADKVSLLDTSEFEHFRPFFDALKVIVDDDIS